jgi:eukaryotic-like serine/threonine-protein kinase
LPLSTPWSLISFTGMSELLPEAVLAGRFRLDRLIGEGGMGVVWAATHVVTRRPVALKMLRPERATDKELRQRFFREARAACAARHPNILEIHDVLELDDGTPMMVMDLLEGETLGAMLDRQPVLTPAEVARLLLPVVSAVGTAHASGVVHRDLKPDNIFLARQGDGSTVVKVLDFGIAKVFASETEAAATGGLTGTGTMLGTPYYMAPEQIFGERDIDHRADTWALGVILYECLSGRRPTQADNIGQILKIITTDGVVALELAAPRVPRDLTTLVGRMLSRDRNARPQSLSEVQAALRRYTDEAARSFGEPAATSRPSLSSGSVRLGSPAVSGTAATLASTTASTTADRLAASRTKSRTPMALTAVVLALGLLGVAAVVAWRAAGHATPASPSVMTADTPAPPASAPLLLPGASPVPAVSTTTAPAGAAPPASTAASVPRPRPAAAAVAPVVHAAPPSATAAAPRTTAASPGGVVEKPPF